MALFPLCEESETDVLRYYQSVQEKTKSKCTSFDAANARARLLASCARVLEAFKV